MTPYRTNALVVETPLKKRSLLGRLRSWWRRQGVEEAKFTLTSQVNRFWYYYKKNQLLASKGYAHRDGRPYTKIASRQ